MRLGLGHLGRWHLFFALLQRLDSNAVLSGLSFLFELRLDIFQLEEDLVRLRLELSVHRAQLCNLVVFLAELLIKLFNARVLLVFGVQDLVQLVVENNVTALRSLFCLLENLLFILELLLSGCSSLF